MQSKRRPAKRRPISFSARFEQFRTLSALLGRNDDAQRSVLAISVADWQALISPVGGDAPSAPIGSSLASEIAFQNYLMLLMLASSSALLDIGRGDVPAASAPIAYYGPSCSQWHATGECDRTAFTRPTGHAHTASVHQHEGAA